MKKLIPVLRFIDGMSEGTPKTASYLLIILTGLLVYETFMRYFLNSPTRWIFDMSMFIYGGVGLLSGLYALRERRHIKMDFFYNRFSPRGKAIIDTCTSLLFFIFMVVLTWKGVFSALRAIAIHECSHTAWAPPVFPVKMVIPITGFLMLLQGLAIFIRDLFFAVTGRDLS